MSKPDLFSTPTMNRHVTPADFESLLPPLHPSDNPFPNLRDVVSRRQGFGAQKLRPADLDLIRDDGYAAYFMRLAANVQKIGGKDFEMLRDAGRLELTVEYVLFHQFRSRLEPDLRRRIASLLANAVTHPDAKWESQSHRSAEVLPQRRKRDRWVAAVRSGRKTLME